MNNITSHHLLITSPEGYAARLTKAFEEAGQATSCHLISVPMIQTNIYTEADEFQYLLSHLNEVDYLAFCSRKAIEAFAVGLTETGFSLPASLGLCAIGKDNELLKERLHTEPAFISKEPSPKGIVDYLQGMTGTQGKRIAVLAPQVIGMDEPDIVPNFISGLEAIGMHPVRVTAYQTQATSTEILKETSRKIQNKEIDTVVFTSGTEINVFLRLIPEGMPAAAFVKDLTIICYGPYTASCANHYGLKVDFTSSAFGSFQELVDQISSYYNKV